MVDTGGSVEVPASRPRLAVFGAYAVGMFGWPAMIFLQRAAEHPHRADAASLAILAVLLLAAALALVAALVSLWRGPVVTLSPAGFSHKWKTGGTVPWTAVKGVRKRSAHGIGGVEVAIDAASLQSFQGSWSYRLGRMLGFGTIYVSTLELATTADDLAAAAEAYRDAAVGNAPTPVMPIAVKHKSPAIRRTKMPGATLAIMVVLVLVFAAQVWFAPAGEGASSLSATTLTVEGALNRLLIQHGQWWRILTGPMLHGGIGHLIGNAFALLLGGAMLERRIGSRWFVATYACGALGGAVASLAANPENLSSVGASGAITGLFASTIVVAFREKDADARRDTLLIAARLLLPSLLPFGNHGAVHIDVAAHVGGAFGGLVAGAAAAATWDRDRCRPRRYAAVTAVAVAYVTACTVAAWFDLLASGTATSPLVGWRRMAAFRPAAAVPQTDAGSLFRKARSGLTSAELELRRLALSGSPRAQAYMGLLHDPSQGKAQPGSSVETLRWYRMAAEQDLPLAETNLGLLLAAHWPGIPSDFPEAMRWLQRVAPISMAATRGLGLMYRDGRGVPRDPARALALLEDAALRGDLIAEKLLVPIYDDGGLSTVAQSEKAVRMLRLAALQNDHWAMRVLAEHYGKGAGVPASPSEALAWYARAASRGDPTAQDYLRTSAPDRSAPDWGATWPVVEPTPGNDAAAERARCVEERITQPAERMARDLPTSFDQQKARSAFLAREYGRDPRVRYARAAAMYDADADDVATVDLQCALDDEATWYAAPYVQPFIYTLLARIEEDAGRADDARRAIAPACASHHSSIAALDLALLCAEGTHRAP